MTQYIVDYIVGNTVGKLVEGKTPEEIAKTLLYLGYAVKSAHAAKKLLIELKADGAGHELSMTPRRRRKAGHWDLQWISDPYRVKTSLG